MFYEEKRLKGLFATLLRMIHRITIKKAKTFVSHFKNFYKARCLVLKQHSLIIMIFVKLKKNSIFAPILLQSL